MNGEDLTQATHSQAKRALSQLNPTCKLTVYREKAEESLPIEKEGKFQPIQPASSVLLPKGFLFASHCRTTSHCVVQAVGASAWHQDCWQEVSSDVGLSFCLFVPLASSSLGENICLLTRWLTTYLPLSYLAKLLEQFKFSQALILPSTVLLV